MLACSALKRAYRDVLRTGAPRVRFVHLHGDPRGAGGAARSREGHFFPPDLLASQFATLEPLGPDEDGVVVDVALDPAAQVREGLARPRAGGAGGPGLTLDAIAAASPGWGRAGCAGLAMP